MKGRSISSGKTKTVPPGRETPAGKTPPVHQEQAPETPAPEKTEPPVTRDAAGEGVPALVRVLEQLSSEPGATLFIAHPLTPERQKQLADLLLADARGETSDVVQKLRKELSEVEEKLQQRMVDVARLNDVLANVLQAVGTPVVVVGNDLRIQHLSPAAEQTLNMRPESIGHEITSAKLAVQIPGLQSMLASVMATADVLQQEVVDDLGRWFKLQVTPYKTADGRVEGAVLTFPDIDAEKRGEALLRSYQMKEQRLSEIVRGFLVVLDPFGTVMMINRDGCDFLRVGETEIIGAKWFEAFVPKAEADAARSTFDRAIKGEAVDSSEYPVITRAGEERVISWRWALLRDHMDNVSGMICSGEDRTALRQANEALRKSEERLHIMMETVGEDEFFITDPEGYVGTWICRPETPKSYSAEEMVGQHYSLLFVPDDFQSGKPMRILEMAEKEGRFHDESWRLRKDGTRTKARIVIIPVRDSAGNVVGFSHATQYPSGHDGGKATLDSSFASLHGYPLREGE